MAPSSPSKKLLVLELWGLGDLTFATSFLEAAFAEGWQVTLAGKPHARPLLASTFPELHFLNYDAPWTAFRGKYRFWRWDWLALGRFLWQLRREGFSAAVSVRADPRDHLLLWLSSAGNRIGFPRRGSGWMLTRQVTQAHPKQHRVEDWQALAQALSLPAHAETRLDPARYHSPRVDELVRGLKAPLLCLHAGARIAVRRWPIASYAELIAALRREFSFSLLLITDPDGYGAELAPLADAVAPSLNLSELVDLLGRATLFLGNDSGPGHIAAACGRPAISIFGPTDPDWFRPWGEAHHVVIRDLCPLRPCFDYCPFPEPYCLTRLRPAEVIPEVLDAARRALDRAPLNCDFPAHHE